MSGEKIRLALCTIPIIHYIGKVFFHQFFMIYEEVSYTHVAPNRHKFSSFFVITYHWNNCVSYCAYCVSSKRGSPNWVYTGYPNKQFSS